MRGRKPKPQQQHKREGTFRPDRHSPDSFQPTGLPECPSHLNDEAKAEWGRLVAELRPVLAKVDRAILAAFCQVWSRLVEAEMQVAATAAVIKTTTGEAKVNPWLRIADECRKQLKTLASELGLTPASRSRIDIPKGATSEDPLIAMLKARAGRN